MAIIRWNPWNLDRVFEDDFDFPTIPGISKLMGQGINIYETQDSLIAETAVPGLSETDIDVTFENGVVRVSGTKEEKQEEKDKKRYFMSSMATSFNYSFRIPEGAVKMEEPQAELEDGILRLTFSKVEKKEPTKIKVTKKTKAKEIK